MAGVAFPEPTTRYQMRPPSTGRRDSPGGNGGAGDAALVALSAGGGASFEHAMPLTTSSAGSSETVRMVVRGSRFDPCVRDERK
jgi:hypothetical protein